MAHSLPHRQYLAMLTYSFRLDFSDETYDVVSVDAPSLEAALALLPWAEVADGACLRVSAAAVDLA